MDRGPRGGSSDEAEEAHRRGARLYAASNWSAAGAAFGGGILAAHASSSRVFQQHRAVHSNRSAALQHLDRREEALADARAATALTPAWAKGWARLGLYLDNTGAHLAAAAAYEEARRRCSQADAAVTAEDYRKKATEQRAKMTAPSPDTDGGLSHQGGGPAPSFLLRSSPNDDGARSSPSPSPSSSSSSSSTTHHTVFLSLLVAVAISSRAVQLSVISAIAFVF